MNRVVRRGGRWLKRRVAGSTAVITAGNVYLRRAGRFSMLATPRSWARHEVDVYRALYGDGAAGLLGVERVWMAHTPGVTLAELVRTGAPTRALHAAGVELRRMHDLAIGRRWFSHGDLHLENVLFCAEDNRARVIDFETVHTEDQGAAARHADDLACLALDLAATSVRPAVDWAVLLRGYGPGGAVRYELARRLGVARGLAPRSLQILRSRYLPREQLAERLGALRAELGMV
ncbi:hypothetical protein EON77_12260 [bacterium]|nr:MAG: hypothetical protein EON77_12260 [bacterium]